MTPFTPIDQIEGGVVEPTELAPTPVRRTPADEIPSMIDQLRANPIVHYGLGVSVKRQGIGWQVFTGSRLVCAIHDVAMVDVVARALVGFTIGEGVPPWCCPKCKSTNVKVLDSRHRTSDRLRRKECECGARYSTTERVYVGKPGRR